MSITRREFLELSALATGALVVGCSTTGRSTDAAGSDGEVFDTWLAITTDDRILLRLDKVEMGQGTSTAYATLIGEELGIEPDRIELVSAPVDSAFGLQVTGGSGSMAAAWTPLRETGARAREALRAVAAERWGVAAVGLIAEDGEIRDPESGRRARYGELAQDAARRGVESNVALKDPSEFRYIGHDRPRVDAQLKSTGQAEFGIDVRVPDMRVAVVAHCPHPKGALHSFDATAAREVPGVEDVFEIPGGVAVVATSYWRARTAAAKLKLDWDTGESRGVDDAMIRKGLADALDSTNLHEDRDEGDVESELADESQTLSAEYRLPYLAHATMEPMNCTVVPGDGRCDVHAGTQAPGIVQDVVAHVLGLSRDRVHVRTTFLGGGFGRRALPDLAAEAAEIVKRINKPVKLVWSREDDMAQDYYRPASLHRLRARVSEEGELIAWDHALAVPALLPHMKDMAGVLAPQWMRGATVGVAGWAMDRLPSWIGPNFGSEGAVEQPYASASTRVRSISWDPGIPIGVWRSVGHSHNGFVVEGFVDELAHRAGEDPAAFRRKLLAKHPRHLAVLDLLVEKAKWGKPAEGRHQGIAIHESFGTVVGEVAEISLEAGRLRVHDVTCVVDCGRAVNPDVVRAQIEGGVIFGLTAALYGEIHFKDGAAVESNFHDHRMLRLSEAPDIQVHIIPSANDPTGVGEPGTPPIAPAVGNAIFAATSKRLRALPFDLGELT